MKLVICNTEITQDDNGRYSLNDLHKASGSKVKDLPNKFMASKSFKNILDILNAENSAFSSVVKKQGRYSGGTWICKELVYKYAMWVDPSFELMVIRTFDSIKTTPSTMIELNKLAEKIESDKQVASVCGKELAKYRKVKKKNAIDWDKSVDSVQMNFGFEGQ